MISVNDPNKIIFAMKNKEKVNIFLDMDGVCFDWLGSACSVAKINENDEKIREKLKKAGRLHDLHDIFGGKDKMWDKIDKKDDFWFGMGIFPWAKKLVDTLKRYGEISFLSSPGKLHDYPESVAKACHGKCLLVHKFFPEHELLLVHNKEQCANKKSILIDDSEKKVKRFKEAGGKAYLFPNQYKIFDKEIDIEDVIKEIVKEIRDI
jgi:hypothetical protein